MSDLGIAILGQVLGIEAHHKESRVWPFFLPRLCHVRNAAVSAVAPEFSSQASYPESDMPGESAPVPSEKFGLLQITWCFMSKTIITVTN